MDQVQTALAGAKRYLGGMTATQKLLLVSLAVIVAMSLFLVTRYAAQPAFEPLTTGGGSDAQVASVLTAAGITTRTGPAGELLVPAGMQQRALAMLADQGALPDDTTILFNNLVTKQDWRNSREQNRQQFVFALQNELGRVIGQLRGVQAASVIIDAPEPEGLGRAVREATASATVWSSSGGPLRQDTVDAVANLVAGARAGLRIENVRVIDGSTGTQRRATDESQMHATSYLEHASLVENETKKKLEGLLAYIPGVTVAVTAQVDVTRVSQQTKSYLPLNDGTVSLLRSGNELSVTETDGAGGRGGEPGVRSMVGADINTAGGAGGPSMEQTEGREEFENAIGTELKELVDPRGMPTFLAASVNIPESYIEDMLRREGGDGDGGGGADGGEGGATREAIRTRFDEVRDELVESVRPHLKTRGGQGELIEGEVQVALVPTGPAVALAAPGGGFLGMLTGSGGSGGVLGGRPIDTLLLAALTAVSLGMMVLMVKKGSKKIELPSPEEIVGVPPAVQAEQELYGEADEGDSAMAGIEVTDEELARSKALGQVSEFVRADPPKAALLLGRWMAIDD
ncbi:MAG: hypothetical protein AAF235_00705 [Planctomycetota bacterium]